jgi:hypothetical protein
MEKVVKRLTGRAVMSGQTFDRQKVVMRESGYPCAKAASQSYQ